MSKIANDNPQDQDGDIKDDIILPFQLQESGLRGRAVRLGSTVNDIIKGHDYPESVSHLLADMITLSAALSSMLKFDGIFTLQASGKGPVKTIVADMTSEGAIRGCASFDKDALNILEKDDGFYDGYSLESLTGEGYLAFTVDQGAHTDRYQGIVSLQGNKLQDSVSHYFEQSEQLRTSLCVASQNQGGEWRSGALMIQFLPDDQDSSVVTFDEKTDKERKEDWNRSKILLETCHDDELTDRTLHVNELLRRLFHEEGVIVYGEKSVFKQCRCSEERVRSVIDGLSEDDKAHAAKDGKIEMTCEFCSQTYTIDVEIKANETENQ
jgi:molecular chaperone Hsp33